MSHFSSGLVKQFNTHYFTTDLISGTIRESGEFGPGGRSFKTK